MSETEISKKELLELTQITYGQLYRWKRKQLIPEEWFVKRSSFTGQETYFPRERILERIEKILNLKDDFSLDQLADTFSAAPKDMEMSLEQLLNQRLVSEKVLENYKTMFLEPLSFADVLGLMVCEEQLQQGLINLEEGRELIQFLQREMELLPEKAFELMYIRKMGVGFWVLLESGQHAVFDEGACTIVSLSIQNYMERIKTTILV